MDFEASPRRKRGDCRFIGLGQVDSAALASGLRDSERGGVYYDDKDLETLDLRLVRGQIGTVLETAGLVPGTIFENIAGSAPLARDQVMEATRLAGLDADIAAMPLGLDTLVTEGGSQLSVDSGSA